MSTIAATLPPGAALDQQSQLEELQLEALEPVLLASVLAAFGVQQYLVMTANAADLGALAVTGSLLAAAGAARWARRHDDRLAAGTLVLGLAGAIAVALSFRPSLGIAALFAPAVILAAGLLGWRAASLVALLATADVLAALGERWSGETFDVAVLVLAVWCGLVLSWLLIRPARIALSWAWQSYEEALRVTRELRERQAELGRLSKSLQETCYRLECLNRELDEARKAADDARKLKSQFAASISHELRTPLNLIIGFSEMMVVSPRSSCGEPLPASYAEDVEAIYRNACHISSLIDDILDLSQIDAQRMALQKQRVALADVVGQAISTLAARFAAEGLSLVADLPGDLPMLYLDPTRIRQVLVNLLMNALRFTDEGGVTVRAKRDGQDVVVSVSDTGVGIAPADMPLIFEEFRQASPEHGRHGGTGLGLALCKRFVEMHGGSIWVTSRLGEGSTFYFSLPLCDNVVATPRSGLPPWVTSWGDESAKAIVVLDEQGEAARVFERYLDSYSVIRATDVHHAARAAEAGPVRAVLASSPLTEASLEELRRARGPIERVPLISCPLRTSRLAGSEIGAADYLVKPVTRDRLRAALRAHAGRLRSVLIADDDPEMVRLLALMVRSCAKRCQVWTASDGGECLELLRAKRPDVVLLDLLMPGIDGYRVLEAMRADDQLRAIPAIVVTAKGVEDETVVASALTITRPGGLTVGEAMRCLRSSLDALLDGAVGTAAARPAGSVG